MKADIPLLITILGNEDEIFVDVDYLIKDNSGIQINTIMYGNLDIEPLINPVQLDAIKACLPDDA